MAKTKTYDAIVVGGGLSGLSLSCLLGQRGMNIACIDQVDPNTKPKDMRTTVISYGSSQILDRAGVWSKTLEAAPIDHIEILDGNSPVLLEFMKQEAGGQSFGWNVDNHELKIEILKRFKTLKNIDHIAPANVTSFSVTDQSVQVYLDDGTTLETTLIIGADGRRSTVRDFMVRQHGLQTRQWSYHQRAVICNIIHENPHNNIAIEHFFSAGPFAILPLSNDSNGRYRSSIVFTEHEPANDSLMDLSDEEFELTLAARCPARYGKIELEGRRMAYPLGLVHAAQYIAPRMVLVADAAHGIHPIAGQGLNLGFRDLGALDEIIGQAFENGEDISAPALLETYQRRRRPDNVAMIAATEGLNRLFSNRLKSVGLIRKAGLKMVSKIRPAKKFFMKQAMGDR